MSGFGRDIMQIGSEHLGQRYVFGAHVPLDGPGWRGPCDCSKFASWCVYQAYGLVFGAGNVRKIAQAINQARWAAIAIGTDVVLPAHATGAEPGAAAGLGEVLTTKLTTQLIGLFVVAIILELALTTVFNWRVYRDFADPMRLPSYGGRTVNADETVYHIVATARLKDQTEPVTLEIHTGRFADRAIVDFVKTI